MVSASRRDESVIVSVKVALVKVGAVKVRSATVSPVRGEGWVVFRISEMGGGILVTAAAIPEVLSSEMGKGSVAISSP